MKNSGTLIILKSPERGLFVSCTVLLPEHQSCNKEKVSNYKTKTAFKQGMMFYVNSKWFLEEKRCYFEKWLF